MMKYPNTLLQLTEQVTHCLLAKQRTVCTAESCTGGYLAQMLTALPGSSSWFDCGLVTYSNAAKTQLLGVPDALIMTEGAVSKAVALAMAQGALSVSHADLSIAITGIAGPTGETLDKPIGTVWFASQLRNQSATAVCKYFSGNRDEVREQAVRYALGMIMDLKFD